MIIEKKYIPIFRGIDRSVRRLPMLVADSKRSGPVIWLTAAIHGNEVTGTAVIQTIFKRLEKLSLNKGRVYAFPILNPTGFETISRSELYANEDLNRCFDGEDEGSTAERLASLILQNVLKPKPDYVIDFHTDSMNSIAYTLIDKPTELKDLETVKKSIDLAKQLGLSWAVDTEDSAGYPPEKCFTGQLIKRGVPAVTIELGGPLMVIDKFRKIGVEAVWQFLALLKMIPETTKQSLRKTQEKTYGFHMRIRTQSTGIIDYRVNPGQKIKKDQILGKIRNVFGETIETIRSPVSGLLFSYEDQSVVFPGQSLFTLAVENKLNLLVK